METEDSVQTRPANCLQATMLYYSDDDWQCRVRAEVYREPCGEYEIHKVLLWYVDGSPVDLTALEPSDLLFLKVIFNESCVPWEDRNTQHIRRERRLHHADS